MPFSKPSVSCFWSEISSRSRSQSRAESTFFAEAADSGLTIKRCCELLEIPRSSIYYVPKKRSLEQLEREERIKRRLDYWHTKSTCSGVKKLRKLLREHENIVIGRKLLRRYMDEMGIHLDTAPVMEAVKNAIARHGTSGIINSDQGTQFTSNDYRNLLKRHGIRQSMDEKARWVDNVIIERWFRSLKTEYVYIHEYNSPRELRAGIREYIDDYNSLRPHQSHSYDTPEIVQHKAFAA